MSPSKPFGGLNSFPIGRAANLPGYTALVSTFLALAVVCVSLRLWTRLRLLKVFGWDDAWLVVTLLLYTTYCGSYLRLFITLKGKTSVNLAQIEELVVLEIILQALYPLVLTTLKISLALFLLRIVTSVWHRRVLLASVCLSTITGLVCFFIPVFQCGAPYTALTFMLRSATGKCIFGWKTQGSVYYAFASVTTLTDFIFAVIPVLLLRESMMPKREKVTIYFVLAIGGLAGIASLFRFYYVHQVASTTASSYSSGLRFAALCVMEPGLGIIASSLATLRKLIPWLSRKLSSINSYVARIRAVPSRDTCTTQRPTPSSAPKDGQWEHFAALSSQELVVVEPPQTHWPLEKVDVRDQQDVEKSAASPKLCSKSSQLSEF